MGHVTWSYEVLKKFCTDVFHALGFNEKESETIRDVILDAELCGIEHHGLKCMIGYQRGIKNGTIRTDATPELVCETSISAVLDGHNGMGQLISVVAMKKAIEKAKKAGIGVVAVRKSNHFGTAGYYTKMACDEGLLGMAFTNSEANLISIFDKDAMSKSNPVSVAIPADPEPFFFDFSALSKVKEKQEEAKNQKKGICHGFVAINPRTYGNAEIIRKHFLEYVEPKDYCVYGEKEKLIQQERREHGIPVKEDTMENFEGLCKCLKLDFFRYFKEYKKS